MIESLRVLMACRKTALSARRVALQMIHNTIVCARRPPRSAPQPYPHAARSNVGRVAPGSDRISRPGFRLSHRPKIPCSPLPRTA
jgi:hypothetical protein